MAPPSLSDGLILLHGLAGYGGEWQAFLAEVDSSLAVSAPDLPGHGDNVQGSDMSADAFVRDVADLVREDFGGEPVVLVGQSMGGIVATLFAARHPELVRGLVLVESGMEAISSEGLARVDRWIAEWPTPFADLAKAAEFFGGGQPGEVWAQGLAEAEEGLLPKFDRSAIVSALKNLGGDDRWDEWSKVSCPVLVCIAGKSFLSEPEISLMAEHKPEVRFERFAGSGHDIHLEQPKQLASAISSFVDLLD